MENAVIVLSCALSLLNRTEASFPPIHLVSAPPAFASANAEAFVLRNPRRIYLITSTDAFTEARRIGCARDSAALKKISSILVHEESHLLGADEAGAYATQLAVLIRLNVGPDSKTYQDVLRSMRSVIANPARPGPPTHRAARGDGATESRSKSIALARVAKR